MLLVSNNNNNITYRNTVDLEAVKKVSVGDSYSHSGKVLVSIKFFRIGYLYTRYAIVSM